MHHPSCVLVLSLSKHTGPFKLFEPQSQFLTLTGGNLQSQSHFWVAFKSALNFPISSWHPQLSPHKGAPWKQSMRMAHMNLTSSEYSLEKANAWKSWSSSSRQGAQYSKAGRDSSYSEKCVKMSVFGNGWTILQTYVFVWFLLLVFLSSPSTFLLEFIFHFFSFFLVHSVK